MSADGQLFDLLEDLARQADAAFAVDREWEVADVARADYARVSLASRLAASVGTSIGLDVEGIGPLRGDLVRAGSGWLLLGAATAQWLVVQEALSWVTGVSERALPEAAWSPAQRLDLRMVLDRLCEDVLPCVVHLRDGRQLRLRPRRLGADFLEAYDDPGLHLPLGRIAAVRADKATSLA